MNKTKNTTLSLEQGRKALRLAGSFTRLPMLIEVSEYMKPRDWLQLLGEEWESCDNIAQHLLELQDTPFS